ncbi:uncharacterized protein BDW70DRAFT_140013 [Aspergillus foveolatus]|uniref:uncharacterized protein n=1 Tax=Aspergillus foveolatus TaxID=210207 RepID=UPI003CCDE296
MTFHLLRENDNVRPPARSFRMARTTTITPAIPFSETYNAYGPALSEAAREGRNEMVELLLDNGSDIIHRRAGELVVSILEDAISGGHSSTVQLLLDHGAGIEILGCYKTSLKAAAYYGFPMLLFSC